jgi:hypothetical protein
MGRAASCQAECRHPADRPPERTILDLPVELTLASLFDIPAQPG